MILFIICIIILPILICIICDEFRDVEGFSILVFGGVLLLALLNVFALIGGITVGYEVTATYEEKQYNISGLESKTSQEFYLDGQYKNFFCIGYGNMHAETNTEMNYYYFKDNEYGKILESVPTKETYIREKDDVIPSLIWIVEERLYKGYPKLNKWFFAARNEDEKQGIKIGTILEVPLNTIKIEYNVDI